jgi:hypothetical protein
MGGGLEIMTKNKTKKSMDAYINNCKVKKAGVKGSRPEAWAELKALEILVKAARG